MNTCATCGATAPPHFVACPACHALFHQERLTWLASSAGVSEGKGDLLGALEKARQMLPLLPPQSRQAGEVRATVARLETAVANAPGAPSKVPRWLAGLGAFGALLWKLGAPLFAVLLKVPFLLAGLLKAPALFMALASASLWGGGQGFLVGLVLVGCTYVHELGHVFAFWRYGIEVSPPMLVPGFGAFVRGAHAPQAPLAAADVALAGPLWGGVAGLLTVAVGVALGKPWLCLTGVFAAEVNLLNLIPAGPLDGGRAVVALSRAQLFIVGGVGLVLSVAAGSPLGAVAGAGLLVRAALAPRERVGERFAFGLFLVVYLGLLGLRVGAQAVGLLDAS